MTNPAHDDRQYQQWNTIFASEGYYYGSEPGPVARRAVRYHRPQFPTVSTALDVGCGEGQDLAYLAAQGYQVTGLEFTPHGVAKSQQLLSKRGLQGEVQQQDLRTFEFTSRYDLVIAVNSIQFLGEAASGCLDRVIESVAPKGVLGLSLFAREEDQPALYNGIFFISLSELLARFSPEAQHGQWQMLEAAQLWQWSPRTLPSLQTNQAQAFITLIAQRL